MTSEGKLAKFKLGKVCAFYGKKKKLITHICFLLFSFKLK